MEKYLVKEHATGWIMITGVQKGETFKAKNGFKQNINFLFGDERLFNTPELARIHADMLNNI